MAKHGTEGRVEGEVEEKKEVRPKKSGTQRALRRIVRQPVEIICSGQLTAGSLKAASGGTRSLERVSGRPRFSGQRVMGAEGTRRFVGPFQAGGRRGAADSRALQTGRNRNSQWPGWQSGRCMAKKGSASKQVPNGMESSIATIGVGEPGTWMNPCEGAMC